MCKIRLVSVSILKYHFKHTKISTNSTECGRFSLYFLDSKKGTKVTYWASLDQLLALSSNIVLWNKWEKCKYFKIVAITFVYKSINTVSWNTYFPPRRTLKAASAQGRYIALNWVPNQNWTTVSRFTWHHTYSTDITRGIPIIWNIQLDFNLGEKLPTTIIYQRTN